MLKLLDDRHETVPALLLAPRTPIGLLTPGVARTMIRRARRAGYTNAVRIALFGAFLLVGGVSLPLSALLLTFLSPSLGAAITMLALVLVLIVCALGYLRTYFHRLQTWQPNRIARATLADGLCASCGYSITGLLPEADGCVICPECGAAWRIPAGDHSHIGNV